MIPLILLVLIAGIAFVLPRLGRPRQTKEEPMPVARMLTEDSIRARALELRDQLDRSPFGEALSRMVWRALMVRPIDEGLVHEFHRDFCGHGLIRTEHGVKLCDIQDGGHSTGSPIAEWHTEDAFAIFSARQSDFTCSGWDGAEPVFATDDEWYRGN